MIAPAPAQQPHFQKFGRFEIIRKLGRSMSDVYLARDPAITRQVVLKIVEQCHDSFTQAIVDAEKRGATIQQQLHSADSRILEIYDVGEHNGSFFIAMQYAEGKSLAELLREQGRLDPRRAAEYAAEICSQLASLHSFEADIDGQKRAVVHGDIKPSNVQIGSEHQVRLLDFGIAKAISATRKLTHHDLGSPAYCSPERLHSSQVDPQSDLWAVGVCLYEMVSGLPPYQAQTTRKLESVIQSKRPPRALPAECPAGLRAIIRKALAGDAARRYVSAQEFESDLKAFLEGKTITAEAGRDERWDGNATVERSRSQAESARRVLPVTPKMLKLPSWAPAVASQFRSIRGSLLAGLVAGFFVFVPIFQVTNYLNMSAPLRSGRDYSKASVGEIQVDLRLYERIEKEYRWLRGLSPAWALADKIRARLTAAGNQPMVSYRNDPSADLGSFDWSKARWCLQQALALAPGNKDIQGKLALADAYHAIQNGVPAEPVRRKLESASALMGNAPEPHLALARMYVYQERNLGRAVAAWHTAEQLGFRLGPREWEQEGDAYLLRVENSLRNLKAAASPESFGYWFGLLQRDASRARERYEPIAGFGLVNDSLAKLDNIQASAATLQAARLKPQVVRANYSRTRRR